MVLASAPMPGWSSNSAARSMVAFSQGDSQTAETASIADWPSS